MKITVVEVSKKYYHLNADSVSEALDQIKVYAKNPTLSEYYHNFILDRHVVHDFKTEDI